VLARRVEARWRWKPDAVQSLCRIQQELLNKAAGLARPKTKILYSTCSIQPSENTEQIQAFLSWNNRFTLLMEKLILPTLKTDDTFDHDGGYVAVLQAK
jgi:16S rRNA (cytosine967-C5)-methyltransferase